VHKTKDKVTNKRQKRALKDCLFIAHLMFSFYLLVKLFTLPAAFYGLVN